MGFPGEGTRGTSWKQSHTRSIRSHQVSLSGAPGLSKVIVGSRIEEAGPVRIPVEG